jgi:hypothetical protein
MEGKHQERFHQSVEEDGMKTPKLLHLTALIVVAVALLFYPTPAEAADPDVPYVSITAPDKLDAYTGKYLQMRLTVKFCDGSTDTKNLLLPIPHTLYNLSYPGKTIKSYTARFYIPGSATLRGCSGYCECNIGVLKKFSHCADFSMPRLVPRSPAVRVSFKGPGTITSASIYFNDLGYGRSLWLYRYDWGSGRWYGFLNTLNLPLGRHNGRVTTYVDGVRGGGCTVGSFKVVNK